MSVGYFSSSSWENHGLLIHGGLESPTSTQPSSTLQLLPFSKGLQNPVILDDKGPKLSHHSSCLVRNDESDILILVGGWNGHSRTSKVYAFELKSKSWMTLNENSLGPHRVDPPVGLSGHTATKINSKLICVIGREGGIKTQRKFGQMFLLHLDIASRCYWYTESPILPQSRSGHTAMIAPPRPGGGGIPCDFLVFGGRDVNHFFVCGKWETEMLDEIPNRHARAKEELFKSANKSMRRMMGLRYHAMLILDSDCILVHGGRHFKAMSGKDVNGHFFLCRLGKDSEQWTRLQFKIVPRYGHSMVLLGPNLYIIGGFSSDSDKSAGPTEKISITVSDDAER